MSREQAAHLSVCPPWCPDTTVLGPNVKTLLTSSHRFSLSVRVPACLPLLGKQGPAAALTLCRDLFAD